MGGNMEISVTKLQPPWKGWPLRNVRINRMVSDQLMGEVGGSVPVAVASTPPAVPRPIDSGGDVVVMVVNCADAIGRQ
jgi:hypothetical protein